jgi:hypothetical protein
MKLTDTSEEMEKVQIEILKKMKPEERLKLSLQLFEAEKKLISEGINKRHPEYSKEEVKYALIKVFLGDELFEKVYPHTRGIIP